MNKATTITIAAIAIVGIAFGATGLGKSKWRDWEKLSDNTLQTEPENLQKAEDQLMKAIEVAFKDRVPEKELVPVYEKMGDLMMREGKYEDSQKYFLRTVQFNNARHVDTDENIAQLRKLETAYEKSRDYDNALQTQSVLVTLIEIEKSPNAPEYATEKAKQDELKVRLAKFENATPKVKVADAEPVETPAQLKAQESLLTGWH